MSTGTSMLFSLTSNDTQPLDPLKNKHCVSFIKMQPQIMQQFWKLLGLQSLRSNLYRITIYKLQSAKKRNFAFFLSDLLVYLLGCLGQERAK